MKVSFIKFVLLPLSLAIIMISSGFDFNLSNTNKLELTANVATVDLTPPLKMKFALGGYGERMSKPAEGVHDKVWAKALVLKKGDKKYVIVTIDVLGLPPNVKPQLIKKLSSNEWKEDNIMLLPSHSHTSFDMTALNDKNILNSPQIGIFQPELLEFLLESLTELIKKADKNYQPVVIGTKSSIVENMNRNRRGDPDVDKGLTITRIDLKNGKPMAVLVNWTAHPTFMGAKDMLVSGGWPGQLQRELGKLIGNGVTVMYYNGAEGDQSPIGKGGTSHYERAEIYGRDLAVKTFKFYQDIKTNPNVTFDYNYSNIKLPKRKVHPSFMETGGDEYSLTPEVLDVVLKVMAPDKTGIGSVRIGDLLIVGIPGELAAGLGLQIKNELIEKGIKYPTIGGLANEWISYILNAEQYNNGAGYESSVSFYGENLGNIILKGAKNSSSPLVDNKKDNYKEAASDKYRLVWNDDPSTTITIIWDQLKGESPIVYYGKDDFGRNYAEYPFSQTPTRKLLNYYEMNTYYAEIKSLEPDQNYYFLIKDEFGVSKRYYFRTAPNTPKAFTFIVGGDSKTFDESHMVTRESNKVVAKLSPLFVLFNGDFNSGNGTYPDRWHQWLRDWDTLTTTSSGRKIPLVPVHGNHENGNKTILNKIFNAPFQYNDSTNIFYSLSFGGDFIHITALNSEINTGGKQLKWLKNNFKKSKKYKLSIAAYHKPFRPHTSSKKEQNRQYSNWANLFYKNGLSLSADGDSHMHKITYPLKPSKEEGSFQGFIRDDIKGTVFIGEGSWGVHPRANDDDKPWTLQSGSFNQLKWIHVKPESNSTTSIEIFTVITAKYDDKDSLSLFVDQIESLNDDNLFKIPDNINLYNPDGKSQSVKFIFKDN